MTAGVPGPDIEPWPGAAFASSLLANDRRDLYQRAPGSPRFGLLLIVIITEDPIQDHGHRAHNDASKDRIDNSVHDEVRIKEAIGQSRGKPEGEPIDDEQKEPERHCRNRQGQEPNDGPDSR